MTQTRHTKKDESSMDTSNQICSRISVKYLYRFLTDDVNQIGISRKGISEAPLFFKTSRLIRTKCYRGYLWYIWKSLTIHMWCLFFSSWPVDREFAPSRVVIVPSLGWCQDKKHINHNLMHSLGKCLDRCNTGYRYHKHRKYWLC